MSDSVTYTAVLPVSEKTVLFVSAGRQTTTPGRPSRPPCAGLLPAGGGGAALVDHGTRLAQLGADRDDAASKNLKVEKSPSSFTHLALAIWQRTINIVSRDRPRRIYSGLSPRAEANSSDEHLTSADVTVRRLRHGAQRRRLVGGRTAGLL